MTESMNGLRSISAQRLLASDARSFGAGFFVKDDGAVVKLGGTTVFSPAMFLPAVIAQAKAIAKYHFGSADMLGVSQTNSRVALFGVEADILPIDASTAGVLRSVLMIRASQQVFGFDVSKQQQRLDIDGVRDYYLGEGWSAVTGVSDDILSEDIKANFIEVPQ